MVKREGAAPFVEPEPRSARHRNLSPNGPHESRQLPRRSDDRLVVGFASRLERGEPFVEPTLGLPAKGLQQLRLVRLPGTQLAADPWLAAVVVRCLDQQPPDVAVAALGDPAATNPAAAGVFAGGQPY